MPYTLSLLKALSVRGVAILALIIALGGACWTAHTREEEVAALSRQLDSEKETVRQRDELIEKQNKAVQSLKDAAQAAEARASEAVAQAKKEADRQTARADQVLRRQPQGSDDCSSTVDLVNEAIRNNRGG